MTSQGPADIVLRGGAILTVNPADDVVECVAVRDNTIVAVGGRHEVDSWIGPATRVIDLQGRSAVPGFIENHIHMTNSYRRTWLDLSPDSVSSVSDMRDMVAERAGSLEPGQWIWAHGYHPERLREGRHPNRHDLDPASPNNPVGIVHREGMGWTFNTLGLRTIGVNDDTPDPPGGPMHRDDRGAPLGPMFDNTRAVFVRPNLPKPTDESILEDYLWMCGRMAANGITSACEAALRSAQETQAWWRLRDTGELTLRVNLGPYPLEGSDWNMEGAGTRMLQAGLCTGFGDEWIRLGSLTYGVDGGVFGQTAALFQPYSNDLGNSYRGSYRVTPEVAASFCSAAHRGNWQISAVCHGDEGVTRAADAIEKAQNELPDRDLRHRLEHAYLWNEALPERIADLGIIWNTQASVIAGVGRWGTLEPWGERCSYAFPIKTALDHGIIVSGGSDWPVSNMDPMVSIHFLVTRMLEPLSDGVALAPDQAIGVKDAVRIHTYNGAFTTFEEDIKGSLEVGKLADITVLSEDILAIAPERLREVRTDVTILDGKVIYERAAL